MKGDGTLWAWGLNSSGQLGDGTKGNKNIPVQISVATSWKKVFAGDYHTLALAEEGTLWEWGANGSGQLGMGTAWAATPMQVQ